MTQVQRPRMVNTTGAPAGCVLGGVAVWNQGLRIRVMQSQDRSPGGPVVGPFMILAAGDNKHAAALAELVGRPTDAAEVLRVIRRHHPGCVNVVNTSALVAETT